MIEIISLNYDIKELKNNMNEKDDKIKMLNNQFQNKNKSDKSEVERLKIKIIHLINEKENKRKSSVSDACTMVTFKSNSELLAQKNEEIIQENTSLKEDIIDNLEKLQESENEKARLTAIIEFQVRFIKPLIIVNY